MSKIMSYGYRKMPLICEHKKSRIVKTKYGGEYLEIYTPEIKKQAEV